MSTAAKDARHTEQPLWDLPTSTLLHTLATPPPGTLPGPAAGRRGRSASRGSARRPRPVVGLVRAFSDPLLLMLAGAAAISMLVGESLDAVVVLMMVAMTGMLSFVQSFRSERAIAALEERVERQVRVRRDGEVVELPLDTVVAGDVVEVGPGDVVPGDGRLIEATDLLVDESLLTGEPLPARKRVAATPDRGPLLGRRDVLHRGTHVESGEGAMVVVTTGEGTTFGRLAAGLAVGRERTSFEHGVVHLGGMLTRIALGIAGASMLLGATTGRPLLELGMFALALVVGLAPEMLPGVVAIGIATGARRLAARKVIVRRLDAIEDFGGIDVLCVDKTGTLTEGRVELDGSWDAHGRPSPFAAELGVMAARLGGGARDRIDAALAAADVVGDPAGALVDRVAFDFRRRRSSVLVDSSSGRTLIVKGAAAAVLEVCSTARTDAGPLPIADVRATVEARSRELASQGRRVLGVAARPAPDATTIAAEDETGLELVGLLTLSDAPKPDAAEAVERLAELGISVVMLTGDDRHAAAHVARSVGIPADVVATGADVMRWDAAELIRAVDVTRVFASLDPTAKERIVAALRRSGRTVGYLGDGINDVAALRRADVGISVDTAAQIAREASDLVLLEKDLDVIAEGVRIGRTIFANTVKYVLTTLSANLGNVVSIAIATLLLPYLPLLPRQILLLNLISDVPSLVIAGDRVDPEMVARPVRWDLHHIRRSMLRFGLVSSVFDLTLFGLLLLLLRIDATGFRSAWFVGSVLTELAALLVLRSPYSVLRTRPSTTLIAFMLATAAAAFAITEWSVLATMFRFAALPLPTMGVVVAVVAGYALVSERIKSSVLGADEVRR
jgi:P-type Mg2+ transporter